MKQISHYVTRTAAVWLLTALMLQAQPSAFTYQGSLSDGGSPANGNYDMSFALKDAASGGGTVGTVVKNPVLVTNGVFTVELDYGFAPAWIGFDRWLEISVRASGDVAPRTTLSPAQPVNSAPYANFAGAVNASSLIGQVTDANLSTTLSFARMFTSANNQFTGKGSGLTELNASAVDSGTLADVRLSSNVPLRNVSNLFSADQTIEGLLTVRDPGAQTGRIHVGGTGANGDSKLITFGDSALVAIGERDADDRMYLRANQFHFDAGRVGIGTNSPDAPLDVRGGNGGNLAVTGSGLVASIDLRPFDPGTEDVQARIQGTDDGAFAAHLDFLTKQTGAAANSLTQRMRITSEGNVGIGTTSPEQPLQIGDFGTNSDRFLRVATAGGNLYRSGIELLHFASDNGFQIYSDERGGGPNGLHIRDITGAAADTRLFIANASGLVGIGTTSPAGKLTIKASPSSGAADPDGGIRIEEDDNTTAWRQFYDTANDNLAFRHTAQGADTLTLTSGSSVGIGTASPGAKLDVNGSVFANGLTNDGIGRFNGDLNLNSSGFGNVSMTLQADTGDPFPMIIYSDTGTRLVDIKGDNAGEVTHLWVYGFAAKSAGGTTWSTFSDRSLKKDIKPYERGLEEITKLNTVRFRYKENKELGLSDSCENIGFIAQDVQQVIPEAVRTSSSDGILTLDVDPILWASVNAIKELKIEKDEQVALLQASNEQVQAENEALTERLAALEETMAAMASKLEERNTAAH